MAGPAGAAEMAEMISVSRDQPERRLMRAVLDDAIRIVVRGPASNPLFTETRNWMADDDLSWPFSFLRICLVLDLEPERLREHLKPHLVAPAFLRTTRHRSFLTTSLGTA